MIKYIVYVKNARKEFGVHLFVFQWVNTDDMQIFRRCRNGEQVRP